MKIFKTNTIILTRDLMTLRLQVLCLVNQGYGLLWPWADSVHYRQPDTSGYSNLEEQGAVSIRKTVLPGMAIPMLKIRRPNGRLIFNMEIAIRR